MTVPDRAVELVLAKPMDVPTYVEYGAADIGIVGKDVLLEHGRDVYELLDLHIGACRLSLAGRPEQSVGRSIGWRPNTRGLPRNSAPKGGKWK